MIGGFKMNFSEKLHLLRKENGCSQEQLAEQCGAVSKWEIGMALPTVENLLFLSKSFNVSIDYLLRDNAEIKFIEPNTIIDEHICGSKINNEFYDDFYHGIIIKESIGNELIFDILEIEHVEIWKTEDIPKYWTAVYFNSKEKDFPNKLSNVLTGNWYVDMKIQNTKIIVFKYKVLKYEIGNNNEKESAIEYCRKMGIPDNQIDWPE